MADSFPLFGLHDRAGGEFLAQHDFRGWCVDEVAVGLQARKLDYTTLFRSHLLLIMLHMSVVLHLCVGAGPELVEGAPPASGAFAAIL